MLRFKIPPDAVFQAILRNGIDNALVVISDLLQFFNHDDDSTRQEFISLFPRTGRLLAPSTAKTALEKLRSCLDTPEIYECTDCHCLLLYDVLTFYAASHNGMVIKARNRNERKAASYVEPFSIEKINLDDMVDLYFFDQSFPVRQNPELLALRAGPPPHPADLELKINETADRAEYRITHSPFFGRESKEYPDFDYYAKTADQ